MSVISTGGCTAPETTSTPTCLHRSFCELFPSWSETLIWAETFLRSKTAGTSQMYSVIRLGHRKRGWLYFPNRNSIKRQLSTRSKPGKRKVLLFKCQVSVDWVPQSISPICYDASTAKVQKSWKSELHNLTVMLHNLRTHNIWTLCTFYMEELNLTWRKTWRTWSSGVFLPLVVKMSITTMSLHYQLLNVLGH